MATSSLAASCGATYEKPTSENVASAGAAASAPRGVWQRVFDAVIAVRQNQADREIARFLQSRGGKFTDETEREITDRILSRSSPSVW